jgi:hypothetical protein
VFPDRREVEQQLAALIDGRLTPEAASEWARPFVVDDSTHPPNMDTAAWEAVKAILGADLPTTDRDYLYGVEDFRRWRQALRDAPRPQP